MSESVRRVPQGPRRWHEQRWLLDTTIRAESIDWDQPRSFQTIRPIGAEAAGEVNLLKGRVRKYDDIAPVFEQASLRHEARAKEAEARGHLVTAREEYFMAAILLTVPAWSITEDDAWLRRVYERMNANYAGWMKHAPHRVERIELPFAGGRFPAYFHLPRGYQGGRIPAVLAIGGMDTRKELVVAQYGERLLERGFAMLVVDGPGRGESPLTGCYVTEDNWIQAGEVLVRWLLERPEVDPERVVGFGQSFGSYWMTQVAATQPRLKGAAVVLCCHEPGCYTIFERACPSFKHRFMWMANLHDEEAFDRMAARMDLRSLIAKVKMPWLNVIGEHDELSPIQNTLDLAAKCGGPSPVIVYQGERHALSGSSTSTVLGPRFANTVADWLWDRVNGRPAEEFLEYVMTDGRVERRPHPRAGTRD
jgi:pimeloyl-ACP methyl ester carboxylesterase